MSTHHSPTAGHAARKTLIWIVAAACFILAFTHGQAATWTIPLAVAGLPLYVGVQYGAIRYARGKWAWPINLTALALTLAVLTYAATLSNFAFYLMIGLLALLATLIILSDQSSAPTRSHRA